MSLLATVVIPVFNKEDFLGECIACLDNQTLPHCMFEAIFIDDGSSDSSLRILKTAGETRPWMKIVHQENRGVQDARNAGIKLAKGRFIFFLDPDDTLSHNAIKAVSCFFDKHQDETDLVTYPIIPFENGIQKKMHARYKVLNQTGLFDLTAPNSFCICQTTMNICVKNRLEDNPLFDFDAPNGVVFHEDEFYIAKLLREKMTIGFYQNASYNWQKNDSSVSNTKVNSYYLYDNTVNAYQKLFDSFDGQVPEYFQGMLVNDIGWTMRSNAALPTHLQHNEEQYLNALSKLRELMDMVSDDVLLSHPNMNMYHALYFVKMKSNSHIVPAYGPTGVSLLNRGKTIFSDNKIEITLLKTTATDKQIKIAALAKSPMFDYVPEDSVEISLTKASESAAPKESVLPKTKSSWSRVACKSNTATFYSVEFCEEVKPGDKLSLGCKINGIAIQTVLTSDDPYSNFTEDHGFVVARNKTLYKLNQSESAITVSTDKKANRTGTLKGSHGVRLYRILISTAEYIKQSKGKKVWLYCDKAGQLDNAWIQFQHDCTINDGAYRIYLANKVSVSLPLETSNAKVIAFGSKQHVILHYIADYILASDVDSNSWRPRKNTADAHYRDFFHAKLIYLPHSILWAHKPWVYSKDRMRFDRVVTSTTFERANLTNRYGFANTDLIEAGIPRHSLVTKKQNTQKRILLCPGWRNYLVGSLQNGVRRPRTTVFLDSVYYQEINSLLNSTRLVALLKNSGYVLDLLLHPNFKCYKNCFSASSEAINVIEDSSISDYAIGITDYSSISFDFIYLEKPIIYYVPDYEQFRAGLDRYSMLDIPLDDAFGEFTTTTDELIDAIERLIANDCHPLAQYQAKTEGLFLFKDKKQCDRVYKAISED